MPFFRHQAQQPLLRHGEERLAGAEQIAESEETGELEAVLLESTVTHLPVMPLALENLEGMLHEGTNPRCLVVAFLL